MPGIQMFPEPQRNGQPNGVHTLEPSELESIRHSFGERFKQLAKLVTSTRRPLPDQTGNGTYVDETKIEGYWNAVLNLNPADYATLIRIAEHQVTGKPTDDREYLMEKLITATAKLDKNSIPSIQNSKAFVTQLWQDLQHPPQSYLGSEHQYRLANGSYNNIMNPQLGAAGTPYGRTVKPLMTGNTSLPDAGVIFDSIMSRDTAVRHPNGISSFLFYVATIIIHDLFKTDHEDFNISMTSSYLDLAPLYGSNEEEQMQMRTFIDGKIKPDCFSEKRILGFPPGVGALLMMFNRWHNYVVENLAKINEGNRFSKHPSRHGQSKEQALKDCDENLYQTGRLITCGLYVNVILNDYVRTILNLNRTESDWMLDPRMEIKNGPPQGTGNQVSAEFNLVYRWHSAISEKDEEWIKDRYRQMFDGADAETVSLHQLLSTLGKWESQLSEDPHKRPFENLKRNKHGKFEDDDLVGLLTEATDDCANAFGARMIPRIMRSIDILGMQQARSWNLASLNEFRQHFGLTKYQTFEEINEDPYVADQLKHLYETPDHVELYPGLVCEQAKDDYLPGSGIMLPYSSSRAVLSDAVALVRGDRFYTTDYHPKALTNWGFNESSSDKEIDHGCVIYKLFYVAFPNFYEENSVYAHFPLTTKDEMRTILRHLEKEHIYSFAHPKRQQKQETIETYDAATRVMNDKKTFGVTWGKAMEYLMGQPGRDFMLAGDQPINDRSRKLMEPAMYISEWEDDVKTFYERKTQELIEDKRYKLAGTNQMDLIRDVGNIVHVHFCAEMFALPLKTKDYPQGVFTEQELYLVLLSVFICVFFDVDPEHSFQVHKYSHDATQALGVLLEKNFEEVKFTGKFMDLFQYIFRPHNHHSESKLRGYGKHMIERLLNSGMSSKELIWGNVLGTAGGMVPNQGQLFSQMMDFYFTEGRHHWPAIAELAREGSPEADEKLMKYMLEGSRLSCGSAVIRRINKRTSIKDGNRTLHLEENERLFVNLFKASRDPEAFPNPLSIDLKRPVDKYIHFGWGPHKCLGLPMARISLTAVLKIVARLPGLNPAKGPQGVIKKVSSGVEGYDKYLTEAWDGYLPFPCSLKVNWDDEWTKENKQHIPGHDTIMNGLAAVSGDRKPNGTAKSGGRGRKRTHQQTDAGASPAARGSMRKRTRAV